MSVSDIVQALNVDFNTAVTTSIDNRLRIIHNLLTEASTHPKATSDALYRLIGARNALISLRERLIRESA